METLLNKINGFTRRDPQTAFENAIKAGRLSANPAMSKFAGHYMYMHTDAKGRDVFKNIITRAYNV